MLPCVSNPFFRKISKLDFSSLDLRKCMRNLVNWLQILILSSTNWSSSINSKNVFTFGFSFRKASKFKIRPSNWPTKFLRSRILKLSSTSKGSCLKLDSFSIWPPVSFKLWTILNSSSRSCFFPPFEPLASKIFEMLPGSI